jgi:FlaA1/EpsC-like NDP-sugar epimerase
LSGFVPEQDIPITFTGIRPGEKLYEELVGSQESVEPSGMEKISRIQRNDIVDPESLHLHLAELRRCATEGSLEELQQALKELVPTYTAGHPHPREV